jgi:hypothetical protein
MRLNKANSFTFVAIAVLVLAATGAKADTLTQLASASSLSGGDVAVLFPQVGGTNEASGYQTSGGGNTLTFTESGTFRVLLQGGGVSGTSWNLDYPSGTHVLYTGNVFSNQGTGPMTIVFSTPVVEFGFLFQNNYAGGPASSTNTFSVYDGASLVATYNGSTVSTDGGGNVLLFDAARVAGGVITKIIVDGGNSNNHDFSIGPPSIASVPEPGSLVLFGSGLLGLAAVLRRKLVARSAR